jgi:putative ABC transport system permease protein
MKRRRWNDIAFSIALFAYPRAFRHRFGSEMRRDFERTLGTSGTFGTFGTLVASGLAERGSAIARALFWRNVQPHLYLPSGRRHMFWDTLRSDLQHTVRLALKAPLVTSLTILALALGIGANSAIFTVVDSVLMKPLPYAASERLVSVWSDATRQGRPRNTISPANFRDYQHMNSTLEGLEGYFSFVTPFEIVIDGPSEVLIGVTVTPRLFDLLGRGPIIGRTFHRGEYASEVLLSYGFWQRRFGGDPNVVGRTLQSQTTVRTIIGVMPADFTFPYGTMLGPSGFTRSTSIDIWAPMAFEGPMATANRMLTPQGQLVRGVHWLGAIGRMKPGVTVEQVQADMSIVAHQLEQAYPETNAGWGATVVPVLEQTVGPIRAPLLILFAGVAFVLVIATVNVANLVLAKSIARQRELATRMALGAGRTRMIQQALTEGLCLALAGGAAGLLLATWGVAALVALAPPDLPRLQEIAPDTRMLWMTLGVSVLTGVFVGLLPAFTASRVAPHAALQETSRGSVGGGLRHRARAALVVAEVALAVTLTIGAGLLLRSFVSLVSVNPGFEPLHMLTWQMNLPDRIATQDQRIAFYREFLDRMKALPGVVSIGGTSRLPLGSTALTTSVAVDGTGTPQAEWPEVQFRRAVGDYFQTMGIPLLKGRMFNEGDKTPAPPVCIINRTMASQLFPGQDPVGQRIRNSQTGPPWTIIGLVGDVKHGALDEESQPEMYASTYQGPMVSPYIVMRTSGDAAAMVDLVRAEAQAIDKDLPVYRIQTMEAVKSESVAQRRFVLALVGIFGVLALSLAAIGVYGVMSLLVSERTREVGVRLALGARPDQVLKMLVAQATRLALAGVGLGVAISIVLMPLMRNQLYGVEPRDPITLTGVPAILIVVAMLAALLPARRAMKVNPVEALRYE